MNAQNPVGGLAGRAAAALKKRATLVKAISFALVGVINATINYAVFWLGLLLLQTVPPLAHGLRLAAEACNCVSTENAGVIVANIIAWMVAVSGSYVMNSMVTFAAESGRKLTWRAYFTFAASGLLGLLTDTTTLLVAKAFLPIMVAKLVSIAAGFVVNFSMSHFVVFRPRGAHGPSTPSP
jgi:putative flippase GtrA